MWYVDLEEYGAKGDGKTDDTDIIKKAIKECRNTGKALIVPGKIFCYSDVLDLGSLKVVGVGNMVSTFKAISEHSKITYSSFCSLEDFYVDGNNIASYGIVGRGGQKSFLKNIKTRNFTIGGIVTDGLQNSTFLNCNSQYNKNNYLIQNGTRNCKFINCNGNMNWNNEVIEEEDYRNILISNSSAIGFYGGIYERCMKGINVEIDEKSYELIYFNDVEIQGTTENYFIVNNSLCKLVLDKCRIIGDHNKKSIYSKGELQLNDCKISRGLKLPNDGIECKSYCNLYSKELLSGNNKYFVTGLGEWVNSGKGSIFYNEFKKCITIMSNGYGTGARVCTNGFKNVEKNRLIQISCYIDNISNKNSKIYIDCRLSKSPWFRHLGELNQGENTIIVTLQGDETGIGFSSNVNCSFDVYYVKVKLL